MDRGSRLFKVTVTLVKIAYAASLIVSILLPLVALATAFVPGFFGPNGKYGFYVDAVGMRIDLTSGVDFATWKTGIVLSFATNAILALAMLFVFAQLRRLLENVARGTPFSDDNATRIRRIGAAVVAGALVHALVMYAMGSYLYTHISVSGVVLRPIFKLPFETITVGLVVICLSEMFRYGARLQEEHDLTV